MIHQLVAVFTSSTAGRLLHISVGLEYFVLEEFRLVPLEESVAPRPRSRGTAMKVTVFHDASTGRTLIR